MNKNLAINTLKPLHRFVVQSILQVHISDYCNYITFVVVLFLSTVPEGVNAQVRYDRGAISFLGVVKTHADSSNVLVDYLNYNKVPERFFVNSLQTPSISRAVKRINAIDHGQYIHWDSLSTWMQEEGIAQDILSVWFNRNDKGIFDISVLGERGLYNANNQDFKIALSSKRGVQGIMDDGLNLIDQSYVLLFDFHDLRIFEALYKQQGTPQKERTQEGYYARVKIYLFRLPFTESDAGDFFENFWISEEGDHNELRKKAFEDHLFNMQSIIAQSFVITASQSKSMLSRLKKKKTREEFLQELADLAIDNGLSMVAQSESQLLIRAMITDVRPIRANIGTKEDLSFEDRYFIYENQENARGEIKAKRKGVVKAYKVSDNKTVSTGEVPPSRFYQIGGRKVDAYGMYLVERKDLGFNLAIGTQVGAKEGFYYRAEYFISRNMGWLVRPGRSGKWLRSTQLYFEIWTGKDYSFPAGDINFSAFTFGLGKSIYLGRNLHLTPFGGIGIEYGRWRLLGEQRVSEGRFEYGGRIGLNLRHNIQLMGDVVFVSPFGQAQRLDEDGNVIGPYSGDVLNDRAGLSVGLGLRLML